VRTVCLAHIIVDTCSREYNVCFRTIGRWLAAPSPWVTQFFADEFFEGGHLLTGSYYC